jgi:hypothetical protein
VSVFWGPVAGLYSMLEAGILEDNRPQAMFYRKTHEYGVVSIWNEKVSDNKKGNIRIT